jgi:hypothetical protein
MKFENTETFNWEGAVRAARNPLNSWAKSDSHWDENHENYILGSNDLSLLTRLAKAGSSHRKYARMIFVSVDIVCPQYFAAELDTYKVSTVRNSCSFQHKGVSKPFELSDFTIEDGEDMETWNKVIEELNRLRNLYLETKDYKYFRKIRQILPMGYNYRFTYTCSYENLIAMCSKEQRRNHRLKEWSEGFINWARTLPYAQELIFFDELEGENADG